MARRTVARPPANTPSARALSHLEKVASRHSLYRVFDDWTQIVEATLVMRPVHSAHMQTYGTVASDPPEIANLWADLRRKYDRPDFDNFQQAFTILIRRETQAAAGLPPSYDDVIGKVYMSAGVSNSRAGQFFTPFQVAYAMAAMMLENGENEAGLLPLIRTRIRTALAACPNQRTLHRTEYLLFGKRLADIADDDFTLDEHRAATLLPLLLPYYEPVSIADPTCGSGVMCVAALSLLPPWMTTYGFVEFHANDIDPLCSRLAHINLLLHGAQRFWVTCGDALQQPMHHKVPSKVGPLTLAAHQARHGEQGSAIATATPSWTPRPHHPTPTAPTATPQLVLDLI